MVAQYKEQGFVKDKATGIVLNLDKSGRDARMAERRRVQEFDDVKSRLKLLEDQVADLNACVKLGCKDKE